MRRFANFQGLQNRGEIFPGRMHRVSVAKLLDNLLRRMSILSSFGHPESPCPFGRLRLSYHMDVGFRLVSMPCATLLCVERVKQSRKCRS